MSFTPRSLEEIKAKRLILCKKLDIEDIRIFVKKGKMEQFTVLVTNNGETNSYRSANKKFFFDAKTFFLQLSWMVDRVYDIVGFTQKNFLEQISPLLLQIREIDNA